MGGCNAPTHWKGLGHPHNDASAHLTSTHTHFTLLMSQSLVVNWTIHLKAQGNGVQFLPPHLSTSSKAGESFGPNI